MHGCSRNQAVLLVRRIEASRVQRLQHLQEAVEGAIVVLQQVEGEADFDALPCPLEGHQVASLNQPLWRVQLLGLKPHPGREQLGAMVVYHWASAV